MLTCPTCKKKNCIVDDYTSGDSICQECGRVVSERMIDMTRSEYTVYGEEDEHKKRVDNRSFSILEYNNIGTTKTPQDEKRFLDDSIGLISSFFHKHFEDSKPQQIIQRANEIMKCVYRNQKIEKQETSRKNHSRKMANIVTSIYVAFMENGYNNEGDFSIRNISAFFNVEISEIQVKTCMKIIQENAAITKHSSSSSAPLVKSKKRKKGSSTSSSFLSKKRKCEIFM